MTKRTVNHVAISLHGCSCGATFKTRGKLQRHLSKWRRRSERPDGWPSSCGKCGAPWTSLGFDYALGFNCRACGATDADE